MRSTSIVVRASRAALYAGVMLALVSRASAFDYGYHAIAGQVRAMSYNGNVLVVDDTTLLTQFGTQTASISPTPPGLYVLDEVLALNDDGSAFVGSGRHQTGIGWGHALFQREGGPFQAWGSLTQGSNAEAFAVSGDGTRVLFKAGPQGQESAAVAATDGTTLPATPLGILSNSYQRRGVDISRDGSAYIGIAEMNDFTSVAYLFRIGVGVEALNAPAALSDRRASAADLNDDASIVAGALYGPGSSRWACLWDGTDPTAVLPLSSYEQSFFLATSGDGTLFAGAMANGSGTNYQSDAFLWSESMGWMAAGEFFAMHGVSVTSPETMRTINEISADGRTFLGARDDGTYFVVTIPAPSSLAMLGVATLACRRRR